MKRDLTKESTTVEAIADCTGISTELYTKNYSRITLLIKSAELAMLTQSFHLILPLLDIKFAIKKPRLEQLLISEVMSN